MTDIVFVFIQKVLFYYSDLQREEMKARIGPPSKLLSFGKVKTIEAVLE